MLLYRFETMVRDICENGHYTPFEQVLWKLNQVNYRRHVNNEFKIYKRTIKNNKSKRVAITKVKYYYVLPAKISIKRDT